MSTGATGPILLDWIAPCPGPRRSAADLVELLATVGLADLDGHRAQLAAAVAELAASTGTPVAVGPDRSTVLLVRVAAMLARRHPDATSTAAADLAARLVPGGGELSPRPRRSRS